MNDARSLHRQAMDAYDRAQLAEANEGAERARPVFEQAFDLERRAAGMYLDRYDLEPTRSVLLKGAAVMGLRCGRAAEAAKLAHAALAGDPPPYVTLELRDILKQADAALNATRRLATPRPGELVDIVGTLLEARARPGGPGRLLIVDEQGQPYWLQVPGGNLAALVRSHFDRRVRATGRRKGRHILLDEIHPVAFDA